MGFFKKLYKGVMKPFKSSTGMDKTSMGDFSHKAEQGELINMLLKSSKGEGPSLAKATMKDGLDQSLSNIRAGLGSITGVSQGSKSRMYSRQAGAAGREMSASGARLDMQERNDARSQLGSVIANRQNADISREGKISDLNNKTKDRRLKGWKALGEGVVGATTGMKK